MEVRQPPATLSVPQSANSVAIERPTGTTPSLDFFALVDTPPYLKELKGDNAVRFRNRNRFPVLVAIRSDDQGRDIRIPAGAVKEVNLPEGEFQVYLLFSVKPGALYRGDHFRLPSPVELELQVPDLPAR